MAMSLTSMAEHVKYVDQERKEQWAALATMRGHSFPNCMKNNGKEIAYRLLDARGALIKELSCSTIGRNPSFDACMKQHGLLAPLTQLTGLGKEAYKWYFDYQIERLEKEKVKLDEGAITFISDCCSLFTPRRIMWNKHDAYIRGDKTVFAGDKDIRRYMLAIVLENEIKEPAIESGIAAAKAKLLAFGRYLSKIRVLDPSLADEMQEELDLMRKSLQEEVPTTFDVFLSDWSEKYLLSEILSIRALRSASEDSDG